MKKINIGIIGITGLVGQTMLKVLETSKLPINQLYVYASSRSLGKKVIFKDEELTIKELNIETFNDPLDIVFFAVDSDLSKIYAPIAVAKGIYVIDNSSAFRMDEDIPLIVPEVNKKILKKDNYLIANPNCSTIQSVVALNAIHKLFEVSEVNYSTYQAVSGSGVNGLEDLELTSKGLNPQFYPRPIHDNVIPHIDAFLESGFTKEEMKMVNETNKIFSTKMYITATAVRVPVKFGHSVSIHATTNKNIDLNLLLETYKHSEGIKLYLNNQYPVPLDVQDSDLVHIGRVRMDLNFPNKILLWTVAENVRKGAASNAVQIGEYVYEEFIK
ncbi:aspartate-semialdehyde dehydrogenase [Acholeplasma granularum]|uniref:aspartate-semialdehyde dehydrogenase n=1 Tax=Acholeplasma granularum TaxID=264635 RepID=UPI0004B51DC4|nr:aspartate-semialdehyde dehydrogenase [Acholeplasma granularum]